MKNRILIVVDYYSDTEMISKLLTAEFEVSLLSNVSKFLNTVSLVKPNLIILDRLSHANVYNVNNMLIKQNILLDTPIIIISALPESSFNNIRYPERTVITSFFDIDLVGDKILEITN